MFTDILGVEVEVNHMFSIRRIQLVLAVCNQIVAGDDLT